MSGKINPRRKRRNKVEALRDRLEVEETRLLLYIDEVSDQIANLSVGEIYSPKGARITTYADGLAEASERLSEAIRSLNGITSSDDE